MKGILKGAVAVAVSLSIAGHAMGQTMAEPSGPAPAAPAKDAGSVWVQCDGLPPKLSAGEMAAFLLAITATGGIVGGLVGAPEQGDVEKRRQGAAGVDVCNQAIAKETDEIRRVQLALARAVHRIEAKDYELALADVRNIADVAGEKAQETDFQRSLGLSALELEAETLVRLGKPAEAERVGLAMAERAPYDLISQLRALRFAGLTAGMSPEKQAFFDRLARLFPPALSLRYEARQWVGDFAGSAEDLERYDAIRTAFYADAEPSALSAAQRSVAYMLAGDMDRSNALAEEARRAVDALISSGKAKDEAASASEAQELLDFQAVGRLSAEGKGREARAAFAARSRWLAPTASAVALLTERLRSGAEPAELTGALARDPARLRADALAAKAAALAAPADETKSLFQTIRPYLRNAHRPFTSSVWKVDKSRYLLKPTARSTYKGDLIFIYQAYGQAGGEALMMHCALLAKARGKSGFMLGSNRAKFNATLVQYGNPGDPGMVDGMLIDADTVIAALSPQMPKPERGR